MLERLLTFFETRRGPETSVGTFRELALPGGPSWSRALGGAIAVLFTVMALTGVGLMTVYAPSTQTAWASVYYIQYILPGGWMVRGIHHWAANATVALVLLHLLHVAVAGAYRRPREFTWWGGLGLLAVVLLFEMSGFPLPWDQWGYWASRIEVGIIGSVPLGGRFLQRFVQGGAQYGTLTLTRFYALHVAVLPVALVGLLSLHGRLIRGHGLSAPARDAPTTGEAATSGRAYWPTQAVRDALVALAVVLAVVLLAKYKGAPLPAPADATSQYPARPVWYFTPLSQLLHLLQGRAEWLGTMVAPGAAGAYLAALPFIDRGTTARARAMVLAPLFLGLAGAVGLGLAMVRHDAHDPQFQQAVRLAQAQAFRAHTLARHGVPPEGPLEMVRNDPQVRPRELFVEHCGNCHAVRGVSSQTRGPTLDGFGGQGWARVLMVWPEHPALMGRTTISDMPPQGHRLGDEGLNAVSAYLASFGVERGDAVVDPVQVTQGGVIYHQRCTRCHQGEGDTSGTDAAERDAPDLDGWGSREWTRNQILRPQAHENYAARNDMPRFDDKLGERDLGMIVEFMHRLRSTEAPAELQPPAE